MKWMEFKFIGYSLLAVNILTICTPLACPCVS